MSKISLRVCCIFAMLLPGVSAADSSEAGISVRDLLVSYAGTGYAEFFPDAKIRIGGVFDGVTKKVERVHAIQVFTAPSMRASPPGEADVISPSVWVGLTRYEIQGSVVTCEAIATYLLPESPQSGPAQNVMIVPFRFTATRLQADGDYHYDDIEVTTILNKSTGITFPDRKDMNAEHSPIAP